MGKDATGVDSFETVVINILVMNLGNDGLGIIRMGEDTMGIDTMGTDTMGTYTMGMDTIGKVGSITHSSGIVAMSATILFIVGS